MRFTRRQWLLTAGAGAAASGLWLWMRDASSSPTEIKSMQEFIEHMKTYCVGRFLIDAPASVQDASGNYGIRIASVEARPSAYRPALHVMQALDLQIQQREADLRIQSLSPSGSSRFLGFSKAGSAVRVLYYLTPGVEPRGKADGYVARDGGVFFFQTNANDQNDAMELLTYLVEIEPSLAMLGPGEIPRTPGFCIGAGLIATNPKRGENVNGWAWTLPGHPDVTFGLSTRTNKDKVEPGIVDREASIFKEAGAALMQRVKTLRSRRFEIAGMAAQEWSIEIMDKEPEFQLDVEIPGKPNDNANPRIALSMRVGGTRSTGYMKPSLSTGEALALWDALIRTLRLRPGAM